MRGEHLFALIVKARRISDGREIVPPRDRVEALGIEIGNLDLMSGGADRFDSGIFQRRVERRRLRVRIDNQRIHGGFLLRRLSQRLTLRGSLTIT